MWIDKHLLDLNPLIAASQEIFFRFNIFLLTISVHVSKENEAANKNAAPKIKRDFFFRRDRYMKSGGTKLFSLEMFLEVKSTFENITKIRNNAGITANDCILWDTLAFLISGEKIRDAENTGCRFRTISCPYVWTYICVFYVHLHMDVHGDVQSSTFEVIERSTSVGSAGPTFFHSSRNLPSGASSSCSIIFSSDLRYA